MTAPDARPEAPDEAGPVLAGAVLAGPVPREPVTERPVTERPVIEQGREDTDEAWGEYPRPDDEWFRRDRPPHWDDF